MTDLRTEVVVPYLDAVRPLVTFEDARFLARMHPEFGIHPDVAGWLQQDGRAILDELETVIGNRIQLRSDATLHHECFDILEV